LSIQQNILKTPIEYVKGIGPAKGETFRKELNIHSVEDFLFTFPFRYIDRTTFHLIKDITTDGDNIQLKGTLVSIEKIKGKNNRSRLQGMFKDSSGFLEKFESRSQIINISFFFLLCSTITKFIYSNICSQK
jgi:ATP-dependent DNA helicase RecG